MAVGLINTAKELAPVGYQPLLLAAITWGVNSANPVVLRLSSHPLASLYGGSQYSGFDWDPRLVNQDITAAQAVSEEGIDVTPSVSLYIADPDNYIWQNYELNYGFKGAQLQLTFIFWNVDNGVTSGDFSTDSRTVFLGEFGTPDSNKSGVIQVTATSLLNMSMKQMPPGRMEQTCIWNFPQALSDRQAGANSPDSPFHECGYSPDCLGNIVANASTSTTLGLSTTSITVSSLTGALPATPFLLQVAVSGVQTGYGCTVTGVSGPTWTVSNWTPGTSFAISGPGVQLQALGGAGNPAATTTLSGSLSNSALSLTVGTIAGTLPTAPFSAVLGTPLGTPRQEAVIVSAVTGSTWTLALRGAQGSVAAAWTSSASILVPIQSCDYTRAACMANLGNASSSRQPSGDLTHDLQGRPTGRFGGIDYQPPSSALVRPFIAGKWEEVFNNTNQAKYGDLIPINYGTTWVTPKVLWVSGDGNYTYFECLIGFNQLGYIYNVVVNGVRIPHTYNDTIMPQVPNELFSGNNIGGGFWITVNDGRRNGSLNTAITNSDSEPYGNLGVIYVAVPTTLADSQSIPSVQIMIEGPMVRVYSTPTEYSMQYSGNPAWVLLDLLQWAGWSLAQIDLASFIAAAAICAAPIPFHDQFGNAATVLQIPLMDLNGNVTSTTRPYSRYLCSFSLATRRSAADVCRGIRNAMKGLVLPNYENGGLLQLVIKQTLADQQPSAIAGSNYNTPISSLHCDGTTLAGYVAYAFDETNIIRETGVTTLSISGRRATEQPNTITVQFQNIENMLNIDSQTTVDTEDMSRYGQEVDGNVQIDGANNFDQVRRVIATYQAETYRGNARPNIQGGLGGDTGGTYIYTWKTTAKAIHLSLGDICLLSEQQRAISNELVRITQIKPAANFETCQITAQPHNDIWYLDNYGQIGQPIYAATPHADGLRPPYAWSPGVQAPPTGDSMFDPTEKDFSIAQQYGTAADGTAIATLALTGILPVNTPSATAPRPPFVNQQGASASTGGTLEGGLTYYVAICAKDQAGATYGLSMPSTMAIVSVPTGTNTNEITIGTPNWSAGTPGFVVFAGTSPNKLTYQADTDGSTPSSITLTAYKAASWPMPDYDFDHIRVYGTLEVHAGVLGGGIAAITSTTIKVALLTNDGFTVNQWAGYDVSSLAQCSATDATQASSAPVQIFNARIASNTADTLTLAGGAPDPTASGIKVGDVITIRMLPVFGTDATGNYFEDLNLINALNPLQEPYSVTNLAVVSGPLVEVTLGSATPWVTGDKVYFQNTGTAVDGIQTVTVIDSTHATINGLTSLGGTWSGTGIANRQSQGLVPDQETGNVALAISGTGRGMWAAVASNTATRFYIQGNWPTTPDSTTRLVIGAPTFSVQQDMASVNTTNPLLVSSFSVDVTNYKGESLIIQAITVDGAGDEALVWNSPLREVYLFGASGLAGITGAIYINVPGTLAIGFNLAPLTQVFKAITPLDVRMVLKNGPTGAAFTGALMLGSTPWLTLSIPSGQTEIDSTAPQLSAAGMISANTNVILNVTSVGTTFPGSDLTVIIYY